MESAPGFLRPIGLLGALAVRQICESRKTLFVVLLLLVPAGLMVVLRRFATPDAALFEKTVAPIYVLFLLPVTALFYGGNLVRDGLEERNLWLLLTRPVGRARLVLGLYLGMVSVIVPLVFVSTSATFFAARLGLPGGVFGRPESTAAWTRMLFVNGLGTLFYGALFVLFGLVLRWPTVVGIVYLVLIEAALGSVPGPARRLAPSSYLEALLGEGVTTRATLLRAAGGEAPVDPGSPMAFLVVAALAAACIAAGLAVARGKDFMSNPRPGPGE